MTGVNLTPLVQNAHFFSGRLRVKHSLWPFTTKFSTEKGNINKFFFPCLKTFKISTSGMHAKLKPTYLFESAAT